MQQASLTHHSLTSEELSLHTTTMRRTGDSKSPPPKKIRLLGLLQNQEHVLLVEAVIHHQNYTTTGTTIHQLADEVIGISLALLVGNGHFRYGPLACKMFLAASKLNTHFKKIMTGESVTSSSISCVKKYFEDEGTGEEKNQSSGTVLQDTTVVWKSCNGHIKNKDTQPFGGSSKMTGGGGIFLVHTTAKTQPSTDNFKLCSV